MAKNYNSKSSKGKFNGGKANYRGQRSYGNSSTAQDFKYDDQKVNDISWYNKESSLFDLATRIPFNQIMGCKAPMGAPVNGTQEFARALPGIMTIKYVPGIGISENYKSAPNRAFQALYSTLLSRTSTSVLNFTPANVAMIVTAEQSIAQNIALVKRLLKAANVYAAQNLYYPRAIIAAHNINVQDTLNNRGEYVWRLNNIIRDFNSLRVPNMIDTFKRQYFLANNVFADSDLINAQLFIPIPEIFYAYSDLGDYNVSTQEYDGVARLKAIFHPCRNTGDEYLIDDLLSMISGQIELIRSSADFGLINGTLQRAFSDSDFVTIDLMSTDDMLVPLVDEMMAYQIHNATFTGSPFQSGDALAPNLSQALRGVPLDNAAGVDITADYESNVILYTPQVNATSVSSSKASEVVLNKFDSSISNDFIMEATRLTALTKSGAVVSCGTEFCTTFEVYTLEYNNDNQDVDLVKVSAPFDLSRGIANPATSIDPTNIVNYFMDLAKFHRAPRIYDEKFHRCFGDLGFYTLVSASALDKLHFTALLSIFNTDSLTKSVR